MAPFWEVPEKKKVFFKESPGNQCGLSYQDTDWKVHKRKQFEKTSRNKL